MGKWVMMAVLLALLALAAWVFYAQWSHVSIDMPAWAWISLVLGAIVTVAVGIGLMALMFYSSRMGYDESAHSFDPHEGEH
jgi:hypothetical protein